MRNSLSMIAVLLALASPAPGQEAQEGAAHYLQHCATCHGIEAQGDGPMAGVLTVTPADLTGLAARNDGIFPLLRVIQRIDGRDPLVAHGSPMPVYGDFFEGDDTALKTQSGQPVMTSRAIADLVAFLEELQDPPMTQGRNQSGD